MVTSYALTSVPAPVSLIQVDADTVLLNYKSLFKDCLIFHVPCVQCPVVGVYSMNQKDICSVLVTQTSNLMPCPVGI